MLVDRLTGDQPPVHQVWVAPLPEAEPLEAVLSDPPWWRARERAEGLRAVLGRVDRPSEQRTEPFDVDLAGAGGHLAVVGSPRTGKSTTLRSLATALMWRHTPAQVQIYGIDLGGGLLNVLDDAPHVGGIAGKLDREAVTRIVRQLRTEVEDREQAFREAGHESMTQARSAGSVPDVFLLIDGWEAFKREFEGLDREVEELAATGLSFGVHVVVAANRWAEIRPALLDNLGTRLELKLHDAIDSLVSRQAAQSLPADVPGRALTMDALHVQIGVPPLEVIGGGRRALGAGLAPRRRSGCCRATWPRTSCRRRRAARASRSASRSAAWTRSGCASPGLTRTSSCSATARAASRRSCAGSAAD